MINHRYWTRGAPLHRALPGAGGGRLALSVADRDGSRHQAAGCRHPRYAIIMVSHLTRSRYSGGQWENFQYGVSTIVAERFCRSRIRIIILSLLTTDYLIVSAGDK